jgi:hypothetical protein
VYRQGHLRAVVKPRIILKGCGLIATSSAVRPGHSAIAALILHSPFHRHLCARVVRGGVAKPFRA